MSLPPHMIPPRLQVTLSGPKGHAQDSRVSPYIFLPWFEHYICRHLFLGCIIRLSINVFTLLHRLLMIPLVLKCRPRVSGRPQKICERLSII